MIFMIVLNVVLLCWLGLDVLILVLFVVEVMMIFGCLLVGCKVVCVL